MQNIEIKSIKLSGIKNPLLTIIVEEKNNCDYEFLIYADKKLVSSNVGNLSAKQKNISTILPCKCKTIEIKLKEDSEISLIKTLKNSTVKKIFNKFYSVFYTVFHKLFLIIKLIIMGIKRLWHDYHFLVPPKMWKVYWQGFKKRLHNGNSSFAYNPLIPNEYRKWLKY